MKALAYLDTVKTFPIATLMELTGGHPFLVLAPHPDDETLGAGGLIACAVEHRIPASVVIVTDGSGSHPGSKAYPRERLIALRREESAAAANLLGLAADKLHHLDLVDRETPASGPAFDATVDAISKLVEQTGSRSLFVTWEMDPHCDHKAAAAMARAVCRAKPNLRLWAYPIWGWKLDPHADVVIAPPLGRRLDISVHRLSKRAAIHAHRSQMTNMIGDDPDGFTFTEDALAPFLGDYEYFIEVVA